MTQSELEQFLLGFEGSTVRQDKERKLRIFEIDFKELNSIWQNKLKDETLGDFDRTTGENIIKRIEREGDEKAIRIAKRLGIIDKMICSYSNMIKITE
jgi:hypothetical protein